MNSWASHQGLEHMWRIRTSPLELEWRNRIPLLELKWSIRTFSLINCKGKSSSNGLCWSTYIKLYFQLSDTSIYLKYIFIHKQVSTWLITMTLQSNYFLAIDGDVVIVVINALVLLLLCSIIFFWYSWMLTFSFHRWLV